MMMHLRYLNCKTFLKVTRNLQTKNHFGVWTFLAENDLQYWMDFKVLDSEWPFLMTKLWQNLALQILVRVVFRQFGRLEHLESLKRTLLYDYTVRIIGVNEIIKLDIFGINVAFLPNQFWSNLIKLQQSYKLVTQLSFQ